MKRTLKYILLVLILTGIGFIQAALAQVNSREGIIMRPQVKYESSGLRDPFRSYLIKDQPGAVSLDKSKINLDAFKLQGVIWGGKIAQAIINNQVVVAGGVVDGASVLRIEKEGVTLNISGQVVNLAAPGQGYISKEINDTPRL